jgi:hypothetical protein
MTRRAPRTVSLSVHRPSWSRRKGHPAVSTSPSVLSTLLQRFACARLPRPCLPGSSSRRFPQRSPPRLLTDAACGGLGLAPDCRARRALLHLSNSCTSPCGQAMLVTHEPERSSVVRFSNDFLNPFDDSRHPGEFELVSMSQQPNLARWEGPTDRHINAA